MAPTWQVDRLDPKWIRRMDLLLREARVMEAVLLQPVISTNAGGGSYIGTYERAPREKAQRRGGKALVVIFRYK